MASPALREDMIRTYEVIYRNVEDVEIRESCGRILREIVVEIWREHE